MKILGIIPARYGSTRLEGKPLLDIHGKSMIRRVYERAGSAIDDLYVATDDHRITEEVESFGGKSVMTSAHHNSGTNRCLEAYETISKSNGIKYLYAWLDRHPDVRIMVGKANSNGMTPVISISSLPQA